MNMEITLAIYTKSSKPVEHAHVGMREGILRAALDNNEIILFSCI
jgi:hypothetical protein